MKTVIYWIKVLFSELMNPEPMAQQKGTHDPDHNGTQRDPGSKPQ